MTQDGQQARVVINAAGRGTRLELQRPKALAELAGAPAIAWQLRMLRDIADVCVVVGFHADAVIAAARAERPDIKVIYNPEFETTKTASSLMLGAAGHDGYVLSLDGDLLVHPHDLHGFITANRTQIGIGPIQSVEPIGAMLDDDGQVSGFAYVDPSLPGNEWTGLVVFPAAGAHLGPHDGHVFELIEPLLPVAAVPVRYREFDYPSELPAAEHFVEELIAEGVL